MRKIILSLFVALLVANASAQTTPVPDVALKAQMDKIIVPYMQENNIPGAAIAVYKNGHAYYFNYGYANRDSDVPVTKNTLFEIASNTKLFTATLLAYAVGQHQIQLNEPIVHYLPNLADTLNLPIDEVTPAQLASHSSSLPRDFKQLNVMPGDLENLEIALTTWQPEYPIGTHYQYSNLAFALLGSVLQNATHAAYSELLQHEILQPLAMQNTYIYVPFEQGALLAQGYGKYDNQAPYMQRTDMLGAGEMISSTHDLMYFLEANMLVNSNNIPAQLSQAIQLTHKTIFTQSSVHSVGLGWEISQSPQGTLFAKNGISPGFNSYMSFSLEHHVGIIALFNKNVANHKPLGRQILMAAINS